MGIYGSAQTNKNDKNDSKNNSDDVDEMNISNNKVNDARNDNINDKTNRNNAKSEETNKNDKYTRQELSADLKLVEGLTKIAKKLWHKDVKKFLRDDYCNKIGISLMTGLSKIDVKKIRKIHGAINDTKDMEYKNYQLYYKYEPHDNETYIVNELKDDLELQFHEKTLKLSDTTINLINNDVYEYLTMHNHKGGGGKSLNNLASEIEKETEKNNYSNTEDTEEIDIVETNQRQNKRQNKRQDQRQNQRQNKRQDQRQDQRQNQRQNKRQDQRQNQ